MWSFQTELSQETKRRQMGNYQRKQQSIKTDEHQQISMLGKIKSIPSSHWSIFFFFFFLYSLFSWLKQFTSCSGLISPLTLRTPQQVIVQAGLDAVLLEVSRGQFLDLFLGVTQKDHRLKSSSVPSCSAFCALLGLQSLHFHTSPKHHVWLSKMWSRLFAF